MNFFLLTVLLSLSTMIPRLVPALLVSKIHFSSKGKIFCSCCRIRSWLR
ncbi:hypothetical protein [Allobaculum sp. Allo2]|nr:hypothetical protein [Allobaculum sp. Allo2]UNT93798.1 hypothetical protein KWG61_03470 [Allobaculum sp. Allo2]